MPIIGLDSDVPVRLSPHWCTSDIRYSTSFLLAAAGMPCPILLPFLDLEHNTGKNQDNEGDSSYAGVRYLRLSIALK